MMVEQHYHRQGKAIPRKGKWHLLAEKNSRLLDVHAPKRKNRRQLGSPNFFPFPFFFGRNLGHIKISRTLAGQNFGRC